MTTSSASHDHDTAETQNKSVLTLPTTDNYERAVQKHHEMQVEQSGAESGGQLSYKLQDKRAEHQEKLLAPVGRGGGYQ
ncbi:hypothetical protein LTR62_006831 [Meristemomyces frigidus]|uniref:Uncharacterized protein n=1 Tax=Meristemomyces frigidus TaxID=1508187 RepID=A0AAN7YE77_9PEZI|nr:hypothetical protein LTR62_006831 [Meristemomyces frigidus]